MNPKQWYVLYVRSKYEQRIENDLNQLGEEIEAFSPHAVEVRQYSDRKKKVEVPVLKRIVFVKAFEKDRSKVFMVPGTRRYLYYLGRPGVVKEEEIEYLRGLSQKPNVLSIEFESLKPGDRIELNKMGFRNENGVVQKVTNNHIWVLLKSLGHILKVSLN